mmetsp:Transcript_144490/g.204394  ORF Transcript_144490/g.204394 Transcript_144490/m.204394 type:complete len:85 (+) Transcript_144490:95-349(+)
MLQLEKKKIFKEDNILTLLLVITHLLNNTLTLLPIKLGLILLLNKQLTTINLQDIMDMDIIIMDNRKEMMTVVNAVCAYACFVD